MRIHISACHTGRPSTAMDINITQVGEPIKYALEPQIIHFLFRRSQETIALLDSVTTKQGDIYNKYRL